MQLDMGPETSGFLSLATILVLWLNSFYLRTIWPTTLKFSMMLNNTKVYLESNLSFSSVFFIAVVNYVLKTFSQILKIIPTLTY